MNLLPDCIDYYGEFIDPKTSDDLFQFLWEVAKEEPLRQTPGGKQQLNRKTVTFIDDTVEQVIVPKIWGKDILILPFPECIKRLKDRIEKSLGFQYNICLMNVYANEKQSISWHSDREEHSGSNVSIASVSLGAPRTFSVKSKHKDQDQQHYSIDLQNGSLLVMKEPCQERFLHAVLPQKSKCGPRINLTFRIFSAIRYQDY
jgi:alkylated DNA repair dioxygenase AlkB